MGEAQSKFEVGLLAVESHVDSFLSAFKSILVEIDDGLAGLRRRIDKNDLLNGEIKPGPEGLRTELDEREINGSLKDAIREAQIAHEKHERKPEVINNAQNGHKKHEGNLQEEMRQQCVDTRGVSEPQMVSAISTSHQLKNSMSAMKVDNEMSQCQMKVCTDEESGFTDKQIDQMRVRATEVSQDFAKAIKKERETRPVNASGHRSEISQIARDWQTLESKFATTVSLASPPMPLALIQGYSVEPSLHS